MNILNPYNLLWYSNTFLPTKLHELKRNKLEKQLSPHILLTTNLIT